MRDRCMGFLGNWDGLGFDFWEEVSGKRDDRLPAWGFFWFYLSLDYEVASSGGQEESAEQYQYHSFSNVGRQFRLSIIL
jgi:hypothetical protein